MSTSGRISTPLAAAMLSALIAVSAISSILIYSSYQTAASRLDGFLTNDLKNHISQDSLSVENSIEYRLGVVESLLKGAAAKIATAQKEPAQNNGDIGYLGETGIKSVVNVAQVDENGNVTKSFGPSGILSVGDDVSDQRYFELATVQRETVFEVSSANNAVTYVVLGYPINVQNQPDANSIFAGELVIFLDPRTLGTADQLALDENYDRYLLVGKDGIVLHDSRGQMETQNIQSSITSYFTSQSRDAVSGAFSALLHDGKQGAVEYVSLNNTKSVLSYSPVSMDNKLVLGIVLSAPSSRPNPVTGLLDDQRTLLVIGTGLIIAAPAIFILFILIINKRLVSTVNTQEGKITNQYNELESAYEKLQESDRLKDEFINIAAHELRTPVLPIMLSAENLADELPDNPKIQSILRNAKRISRLTNDILDVSRIESNTFKLQKQQTNIVKLIEDLVQDFMLKIPGARRVTIKTDFSGLPPSLQSCVVDKGRIIQVLSNLLDNAVNFTENETITVKAEKSLENDHNNSIKISVIDRGSGIDPEVRDRLFGKFVTKSPNAKGTGLGLYLSKKIIEAHGGSITGDNNPDGKGALFSFTLPTDQ